MSEDLPRRPHVGLTIGPLLPGQRGFPVVAVSGPAMRAGVLTGDLLVDVDGVPLGAPAGLRTKVHSLKAGDRLALGVLRDGRARELDIVTDACPLEQYGHLDVHYGAVEHHGAKLRTILTAPRGRPRSPCVVYLQGHSAASIECADSSEDLLREFVSELGRRGFAVLRVEKPGIGDSEGGPIERIGFREEAEASLCACLSLMQSDLVDADSVFLFGHSMGGIHAPAIAGHVPGLRGAMVFGTVATSWAEYEDENTRRQLALAGLSQAQIEARCRIHQRFHSMLYREQLPLPSILAADPEIAAQRGMLSIDSETTLRGRHFGYWQELSKIDLLGQFGSLTVPVLCAWGEADYMSSERDHRRIADVLNSKRAGAATYRTVEATDHGFARFATPVDSYRERGRGQFSPALVPLLADWMGQAIAGSTS